jgi:hemolysin III
VYWTIKLWGNFKQHTFLSIALVLLYIGGIGGTTYHGLRRWPIFIMMDWMPIMLLCLSAGVYFLSKLTKWYFAVLIVAVYAFFQFYVRRLFSNGDFQIFININYAFMAALVLFPVFGYLIKTDWKNGKWVGFALIAFIFALTFRIADKWDILSIGTHFLWHTFGAVASFCMLNYIYLVNQKKNKS